MARSKIDLAAAESRLQARRRELRARYDGQKDRLEELESFERGEPEVEERAQESDLADELVTLEDREQDELQEVIAALQRIRDDRYGICERCEGEIGVARLEALPTARQCRPCAEEQERGSPGPATSDETTARPPVARAYEGMADEDRRAAIVEMLRAADAGLENVEPIVGDGRVLLCGTVPTEGHRDLATQVVADEIGFDVEQELHVDPDAFPSSGRSAEPVRSPQEPQVRAPREVREETEDVYEAEERGLGYSPPDKPVVPPRE